MKVTATHINTYTFFKLPAAWWCGVRVSNVDEKRCSTRVTHRWINQNPFRSMFWAVQGMAAELATGVLVMKHISDSGAQVSMLVASNSARFSKKATGRITFTCDDGEAIRRAVRKTVETGEGVTCSVTATGSNMAGEIVSVFEFEWTLKLRKSDKQ